MSHQHNFILPSLLLMLAGCPNISQQNPLQQSTAPTESIEKYNQSITCITEDHNENGTVIISSSVITSTRVDPQSPTEQFNVRRRDMYLDDYKNINGIQVIDTSGKSVNRSTTINPNKILSNSDISTSPTSTLASPELVTNETANISQTHLLNIPIQPQRPNLLLPKLESTGRPACVQSPDDTFCEIVDNYPKTAIKQEIDLSPEKFNDIFGPKEIDGRKSYTDQDNDEESVCRKIPRVIYPQMAKNQANQWVYVVNEIEYTQAVVAEICEKPGKPCSHLENMPMGMYSRCKQKYSYKRLLALHPTEKRTYPDAFKFPSCCSCYIKYLDDYLGRSNFRKVDVSDVTQSRDARTMSSAAISGKNSSVIEATKMPSDAGNSRSIEIFSQAESSLSLPPTTIEHNVTPRMACNTSSSTSMPATNESTIVS